ncbi:DUF2268 domain-containing protein [Bacillus sp. 2205SS5-2]|uniref:DUF2268 domain-containing protein n=1 Tax=Bacillus sp. 2205SS5-2 TaxID=3109031 RepID=UPI00300401FD
MINTRPWIQRFISRCKSEPQKEKLLIQSKEICQPVLNYFNYSSPEELHYHLLQHGLFNPEDVSKLRSSFDFLQKNNVWEIIQSEYTQLQSYWNGPNVPIFIFPINERQENLSEKTTKNGIAFKKSLFLFLSKQVNIQEVKALLAHEYHHVCRLELFKKELDLLSIKDVIVLEGLAEYAVKDIYGEEWNAPWTNRYSKEEMLSVWKKQFVGVLDQNSEEQKRLYLYGEPNTDIPRWIGYSIGFHIVNSFAETNGPYSNSELYSKSSGEIVSGSVFPT